MKNVFLLSVIVFHVIAYGQTDSRIISRPSSPDKLKTAFPKGDGLTYNQYAGETISGYVVAHGWRKDTVNGGYNKEIYYNPYISSQLDYAGFDKSSNCADACKSYLYRDGKTYTGKITDTLTLSYSRPFRVGIYYPIETSYERKDAKVIFQAECTDGVVQGKGTLTDLDSGEIISSCHFNSGEIVGEVLRIGLLSKNIQKVSYKRGSYIPEGATETDRYGHKVETAKKLSFRETYLTLLYPYEILKQNEKARQVYLDNMKTPGGLFQNPLLLEPIDMMLNYFSAVQHKATERKFDTAVLEINEFKYDDIKIVFNYFKARTQNKGAYIIECYDQLDRLIMIRYNNVSYDAVNSLDFPDYLQYFHRIGSGYNLIAFEYDEKGNIKKASEYRGVYDNDISTMCEYEDITSLVLDSPDHKPISVVDRKADSSTARGRH